VTSDLHCSWPGCGRRWTVNFGRRLCSEHDDADRGGPPREKRQPPLPGVAAAPHWQDRHEDRDDEPLPF
jgi:hypothetical protein